MLLLVTVWQKGEWEFARMFNYSCAYAPTVLRDVTLKVNNYNDSSDFPEEQPAASLNAYCALWVV